MIAHQRFEGLTLDGLLHRQRVVQQVVRLDAWIEARRVVADDRHERDRHAVLVDRGRRIDVRFDDDHRGRVRAGRRVVDEVADAAGEQDADVGLVGDVRGGDGGGDAGVHFRVGPGHGQRNLFGGLPQPRHVRLVQERLLPVGPEHLVDALAVQEPVIEH